MATLPRQPLNIVAPFEIQNGGEAVIPTLIVGAVVFEDGSTQSSAGATSINSVLQYILENGLLPGTFLDGGTY